jgi:hypothetical protein
MSSASDGLSPLDIGLTEAARTADLFESYATYAAGEIASSPEETRWQAAVDAASAYRTAGQWALLIDPLRARRLLLNAAENFFSTYGYSAFLRAVAGLPPRNVLGDSQQLLALNPQPLPPATEEVAPGHQDDLNSFDDGEEGEAEGDSEDMQPSLQYPQQQAYLLLALSAERELPRQARNDLLAVSQHVGRMHEGHAIGSVGLPLWRFWRAAQLLLEGRLAELAAEVLVPLDHRYTDVTRGAQSNSYLWNNAASPVDVVDLEIVGLTALAVYRFDAGAVQEATGRGGMSPAMTDLIQHGVRLASAGDDHHH